MWKNLKGCILCSMPGEDGAKGVLGVPVKVMSALVYVPFVGWMAAVVALALEKDRELRWHGVQSLVTYSVFLALTQAVAPMLRATIVLVPVAALVSGLSGVGFLGLWLWMAMETNQGKKVRLPILGAWADKIVK